MTEEKNKEIKKLFFRGSVAYWPDERGKEIPAQNLAWQLIRALLRGESVDLLDGFVIFRTWREQKQDGDYPGLFQSQKSKAEDELAREAPVLKTKPEITYDVVEPRDAIVEEKKSFWKRIFGL